jgi:anthranilate phosphoribosyltransferase
MKNILEKLTDYQTLGKEEAKIVLTRMARGECNQSQMAAFITSFMMRSITVEELAGFREAMLELCISVNLSDYGAMDLCGTGGDGKNTFNISTLASFVVAGAGYNVAKHGNNGVSSVCGSSNVLDHFGYQFSNDEEQLKRQLDHCGICFLHAPLFHPAMKNVAPVRMELGTKTFFNMLGPLVNPSNPDRQIIGVYDLSIARAYGYLHQQLSKRYTIVHSLDGYDEISLTGDFKIISNEGEDVLSPGDLGLSSLDQTAIHGGDTIDEAAKIFQSVLQGNATKEQEDVVVANAGLAIMTSDPTVDLDKAMEKARESLKSGKAGETFKKLIELSSKKLAV